MRPFVEQALERFGASVAERSGEISLVSAPAGSTAAAVLGSEGICAVSFGPGERREGDIPDRSAACLAPSLKQALEKDGRGRHAVVDAAPAVSRSALISAVRFSPGEVEKATTRRRWQLTVRCHARVMVIAGEIHEALMAVDVHPDGTASKARGGEALVAAEGKPVEKPPVALQELRRRIETGMAALKEAAADLAGQVRGRTARELYETLCRLRDYHRQVEAEAEQDGDAAAAAAARGASEMRKDGEVPIAAGRIRIALVAVESLAHPATDVTWRVRRGRHEKEVRAVFSRQAGQVLEPVRCAVCGGAAREIGLSRDGELVCQACSAHCAVCDSEVTAADCFRTMACEICRRVVCNAHAEICGDCGRRICPDHMVTCACGCRVCRGCAGHCPDCGQTVAWCRHHSLSSETGEIVCRDHAVFCAGCQNPFARSVTAICQACGQVICARCQVVCRHCGGTFCLHHVNEERCESCQQQNNPSDTFHQISLF